MKFQITTAALLAVLSSTIVVGVAVPSPEAAPAPYYFGWNPYYYLHGYFGKPTTPPTEPTDTTTEDTTEEDTTEETTEDVTEDTTPVAED
ncbi:hypothetical protein QBC38DRAFT_488992 [Podospora fimiseda]|uniref:Uncharacterized protein n=1 Tax=Podospora fimiseda TaxID=252190 RepID=A0AAN6YPX9_9PEZI|nr:hypothetical protein QBC38DRAFT_488992 [Podospora fimiseda]